MSLINDRLMLLGAFTPRNRPPVSVAPPPFELDQGPGFSFNDLPNKRDLGLELKIKQGKVTALADYSDAVKLWVDSTEYLGPIPESGVSFPHKANIQQWDYLPAGSESAVPIYNGYPRSLEMIPDFSGIAATSFPLIVSAVTWDNFGSGSPGLIPVHAFPTPLMFTLDGITPLQEITAEQAASGNIKLYGTWVPGLQLFQEFNQFRIGIILTSLVTAAEDVITFLYNFTQAAILTRFRTTGIGYLDTYAAVAALSDLAQVAQSGGGAFNGGAGTAFYATYAPFTNFPLLPTPLSKEGNYGSRWDLTPPANASISGAWQASMRELYNSVADAADGRDIYHSTSYDQEGTVTSETKVSKGTNPDRYIPGEFPNYHYQITSTVILDPAVLTKELRAIYQFNLGGVHFWNRNRNSNTGEYEITDMRVTATQINADAPNITQITGAMYVDVTTKTQPIDPSNPIWSVAESIPFGQVIELEVEISAAEFDRLSGELYLIDAFTGRRYLSIDQMEAYGNSSPEGAAFLAKQVSTTFRVYSDSFNVLDNPEVWANSEFIAMPSGVTGTIALQRDRTTFEQIKAGKDIVVGVAGTINGIIQAIKITGAVLTYGLSAVGVAPLIIGAGFAALKISRGINQATGGYDTITTKPTPTIYTLRDPKSLGKLYEDFPEYRPKPEEE